MQQSINDAPSITITALEPGHYRVEVNGKPPAELDIDTVCELTVTWLKLAEQGKLATV